MTVKLKSILFALSFSVVAIAETDTTIDSISKQFTIDEVEVVAERHEQSLIPVQHLEGKQLEALSSNSVADALRYFSGVQMKDFGGVGGLKTIDVRSMGTHHLGVFYDGIEVGNAQNGTVDLGKFSMENIEDISLYNGQKSDLLQPAKDYGSAGTLYLRTRRPKFEEGRKYHVVATMKAGSFGLANPSLLYEQQLTENIHLSLNAEYTYATGHYTFRIHKLAPNGTTAWDTTGIRQNGDINAVRAEVGLFGYTTTGKWHVKGYFYDSNKGIPRAIVRNVWTSDQRQWDRNAFIQGQWENSWDITTPSGRHQNVALLVSAKYSNDYMRYLNPDTTTLYIDNQFWQQEVYGSVALRYRPFLWWDIALSGDYLWNDLNATLTNFAKPQRHTGLVAAATTFHYKWLRAQASVLGTFVHETFGAERVTRDPKPQFTPSAMLSYQPILGQQWYIRGFYKRVFRMPTFNDLYYTDIGNISLEPEYTTQYDLGTEYTSDFHFHNGTLRGLTLTAKADGYFNQITNKIIAVPKGNSQYRWQMLNLGYVEILGTDISAGLTFHWTHDVNWSLSGSYTYQRAKDLSDPTDPTTYGGQIAYIPWHSGSVLSSIDWRGLSFHYAFVYVGERYHNSANIRANYERPWYTHDLSVSYLWTLPLGRLSTTVEVNNILNQQYDVVLNYPMPGINGKLIIKYII